MHDMREGEREEGGEEGGGREGGKGKANNILTSSTW
jgi:hypothetical protein